MPNYTRFFTVTDNHTTRTNSTSKRYWSKDEAIAEASGRLARNSEIESVVVLEATQLVVRQQPVVPVKIIDLVA